MKERRQVGGVLGIKNHCELWAQLTFTKRAFGSGQRQSNGWNAKLVTCCGIV